MKDIRGIIKEVLEEIISDDVVIGVSNRHIHLSQKDLDVLFGKDYKLSKVIIIFEFNFKKIAI